MMRIGFIIPLLLLPLLTSCGSDEEAVAEGCACQGDTCQLGQCVIELQIAPGCGQAWGKASIYLGDTSEDATPIGEVTEETPYRSCEPFRARITEEEASAAGIDPQEAESIGLQVVSENQRLFFPPGNPVTMCSGSAPQVFVLDCQ